MPWHAGIHEWCMMHDGCHDAVTLGHKYTGIATPWNTSLMHPWAQGASMAYLQYHIHGNQFHCVHAGPHGFHGYLPMVLLHVAWVPDARGCSNQEKRKVEGHRAVLSYNSNMTLGCPTLHLPGDLSTTTQPWAGRLYGMTAVRISTVFFPHFVSALCSFLQRFLSPCGLVYSAHPTREQTHRHAGFTSARNLLLSTLLSDIV